VRQSTVPVTLGSPWFRSVDTSACRVTEARFSAGDVLHAHAHDRPILAVMLRGSFETAIGARRLDCGTNRAWTEPVEERHANYIGSAGARVLVMQPDPAHNALFDLIAPLLDTVAVVHDPVVSLDARRILGEMDRGDALARLAIDALMVGMVVRVSRNPGVRADSRAPSWLERVRELLHESYAAPPSVAEIATVAGVTPTHVCHAFRAYTGMTLGEYVRTVRAAWAAEQIRGTELPLSAIALAAGYSDQSHFTRETRRLLGTSPSAYRKTCRMSAAD
jgi:AraC family transcriptional regulator